MVFVFTTKYTVYGKYNTLVQTGGQVNPTDIAIEPMARLLLATSSLGSTGDRRNKKECDHSVKTWIELPRPQTPKDLTRGHHYGRCVKRDAWWSERQQILPVQSNPFEQVLEEGKLVWDRSFCPPKSIEVDQLRWQECHMKQRIV